MADDREILREIWDGHIPICFNLAPDELFTVEQPEPYYLLVPRQSYFPLVTDKVQRKFLRHTNPEARGELWLDYEGQTLRWHYPVGVLFDLYATDTTLPWSVTVHFQDFPEDEVLHCLSRDVVESHFMSMVKEADALKHRGQVINGMQKKDHKQLWMGIQNEKFEQFWSVNRKLMERVGDEPFRCVPFRIYQVEKSIVQKLIRPISDAGDRLTLKDLLQETLPEHFSEEKEVKHRVIIQGVEPPLSTPLHWLSEHFSHPDNFLHICLHSVS